MPDPTRLTSAELYEFALDLTRADDQAHTVAHAILANMAREILQCREKAMVEFGRKVLDRNPRIHQPPR